MKPLSLLPYGEQDEAPFPDGADTDLFRLLRSAETLQAFATAHREAYASAKPFPHVVIDDFLPDKVAEAVLERFPRPEDEQWTRTRIVHEHKLSNSRERDIPPLIRNTLSAMLSATFVRFLEELTGIEGLIPDPYLSGGGMHQIVDGGKLQIHTDFNRHDTYALDRRLNLLLFLNREWREEYGGKFEMWDPIEMRCAERVAPVFNRCVIFSTSDRSFHGHPEPLRCGPGRSRKSLALYYFSNGRPAGEVDFDHGTMWVPEIGPRYRFAKHLRHKSKRALEELLPPILHRQLRRAVRVARELARRPSS